MRGIAAYKQTRVESASPAQVVMMLFQETVHRLTRAAHTIDQTDNAWREDLHHVREIYVELLGALDRDAAPEMCDNLAALYQWCLSELVTAGRTREKQRVMEVLKVSTTLLEGWQFVVRGNPEAP